MVKKNIDAVDRHGRGRARGVCAADRRRTTQSIRWSTSSIDSYGTRLPHDDQIREEALGGEYTITSIHIRQPGAMKAAMDGRRRNRLHGRRRHDAALRGRRRLQELHPGQGQAGSHLVRLSDGILHACPLRRLTTTSASRISPASPFFQHHAGFMNWLNFQRMYKVSVYDFSKCNSTQRLSRCAAVGNDRWPVAIRRLALRCAVLERNRSAHGSQDRQSVPDESPSCRRQA